jgi:hypothetical protein
MMAMLNVLLLALHLLMVNVASAGPLVCLWLHGRGRRGDAIAWQVGRRLAKLSLAALAIGFLLGLVQLGLGWAEGPRDYWNVIERVPLRDVIYVFVEVTFSAVCLAIYWGAWNRWRDRPWLHGLFAVLAAANLLYHFPPLMTALGELAVRPELALEPVLTRRVVRGLIGRPEIVALVVHFMLASAAVTGVLVMHLVQRHDVMGDQPKEIEANKLVAIGAWIALVASFFQLAAGTWVLVELPTAARNGLIGGDWLGTSLFAASLVVALGILHTLATIALGNTTRAAIRRSTLLMLTIVLLMTATLARSRQLSAMRMAMHWDTELLLSGDESLGYSWMFPRDTSQGYDLLRWHDFTNN